MFKSIKNFFNSSEIQLNNNEDNNLILLCGLMIEAANTDGNITQDEINKISSSLINVFKEKPIDVESTLTKALENRDNNKSLYFYTSKINKAYSNQEKILLLEILWEIILSDGELHDFESNLIRRLGGLLYISDVDSGNAKLRAQKNIQITKVKP